MTTAKKTSMTTRNLMWLAVIVVVALVVGFAVSLVAGIVSAVVVLAISEGVERSARRRRQVPADHD